jgi:hypothetical protein
MVTRAQDPAPFPTIGKDRSVVPVPRIILLRSVLLCTDKRYVKC